MKWAMLGFTVFCLACGDNLDAPDPPDPEPVDNAPLLTNAPQWTIGGGPCFGYRTVVADVDGNGLDDIVAFTPDCLLFSPTGESTPTELWIIPGVDGGFGEPIKQTLPLEGFESFLARVNAGDVDGDGHDDVVLASFSGTTLYRGAATLDDMLTAGQPVGLGTSGLFFDVDGDGAEEFLSPQAGAVDILAWDEAAQDFAVRDTLPGPTVSSAGDSNGDGLPDLLLATADGIDLYFGCRSGGSTAPCNDGLTEPVRIALTTLPTGIGDVNGDGRGDFGVRAATSAISLHLADNAGLPVADAAWTVLPDPLYGNLNKLTSLGDVNGDGLAGDVSISAIGRSFYFRADDPAPEPGPAWEWHLGHAQDPAYLGGQVTPILTRDFDGDGYQDVVMSVLDSDFEGWIAAYPGGRVPANIEAPYLPTEYACSYHPGALPDLGVDEDLIERSLRIRRSEFASDSCEVAEQCVAGPGERKLLDFSVAVQNFGGAGAVLPSSNIAPELYEFDTCHLHDHLIDFANYELLDSDGAVVVAGHKQGYFLIDVAAYCDMEPQLAPGDFGDYLFISPGWADIYYAGLECQWIDITDVPDGSYRLRVEVNTSGVFEEDDQISNAVEVAVDIAGDQVTLAD